jgi:hypothetical protein
MTILALLGAILLNAQDRSRFKGGFHGGLPVGDAGEVSKMSLGVDFVYAYGASELIDLGFSAGFTNAFIDEGKTTDLVVDGSGFNNVQFMPLAGNIRLYPTYRFSLGVDVGYAVGINQGNEGGVYYKPSLAFFLGRSTTEVVLGYTGISNNGSSWDVATVGILYGF